MNTAHDFQEALCFHSTGFTFGISPWMDVTPVSLFAAEAVGYAQGNTLGEEQVLNPSESPMAFLTTNSHEAQ